MRPIINLVARRVPYFFGNFGIKRMLRLREPTMIFKLDEGSKWCIGPSTRVSSRPNSDSIRPIKHPG